MQGSLKCPYTLVVLASAWNTCFPHLRDLNVRQKSCPFCFQSWELGRRALGMVVQGSSVSIPPPAVPAFPTVLTGALQLLPVKILHRKSSAPSQDSEVTQNLSPLLPFPEIRLPACVCMRARAKFQPTGSFDT